MRSNQRRPLFALAACVLVLGACSSGGAETTSDGIATLASDESDGLGDGAQAATLDDVEEELSTEEIALAFSACMRDEGVDFPDVGINAEGGIELREGFAEIDRGSEDFQSAIEVCQPLIADAGFGGGDRAAIGDNVEIQDALVEFSDCIRAEGFDVGDVTLGGPNAGGADAAAGNGAGDDAAGDNAADGEGAGDGAARGGGQRQEGFGDPSERLAQQLGLDLEDPEVAVAIDACSPALEAAFAEQGAGQP